MTLNLVNSVTSLLKATSSIVKTSVRTKWVEHRMIRDVKRRALATEMAKDRLRVNSLRKNDILPKELRDMASAEIHAFPKDSAPNRITNRCVLTSRPRGIIIRWRVSRIMFRQLAEYNKLAGVQRALW